LESVPKPKDIRVDLLVDDPLLTLVIEAEIARLGSRREVVDSVELRVLELQEVFLFHEIAVLGIDDRDFGALAFQIWHQMPPQKSGSACN